MQGAVNRYRVMAYVTGVLLILLVCVATPLKLFAGNGTLSTVVGLPHGLVAYPLYLVTTFDLYRRARWPFGRLTLVVLAGVVPFLTFWVERRVVAEYRDRPAPQSSTAGV